MKRLIITIFGVFVLSAVAFTQPPQGGRGGQGGGPPGGRPPGGQGGQQGRPPGGPGGQQGGPPGGEAGGEGDCDRMMALDANGDGRLSSDEVTDKRLHPLLNRADADQDGTVTRSELVAMQNNGGGGGGNGGRGGAGGPDGGQGGGPGGPPGGPPRPGEILPPFVQDDLGFTDEQREELAELQREVDERLAKILTADQKKQLAQHRGPGGGPGGRGGAAGGPPSGQGGGRGGPAAAAGGQRGNRGKRPTAE